MKKILALLLALLTVSSSAAMIAAEEAPEATTAGERLLGDINNDESVDILDAQALYQYSMLPDVYPIKYRGLLDYDYDGNVDMKDAMQLFRYSMIPQLFTIEWGDLSEYPITNLSINGIDISEYVITTNGSASSTVAYAATELQKYINLSTGVTIPVQSEGVAEGTKRILIDDTLIVDDDSIYRFFNDEDGLVIAGDSTRGAMYSVYHFLEKKMNWRFFASDSELCYGYYDLDLSGIDYTYEHQYKIRDLYFYDLNNFSEFRVKRYLNGDSGNMTNYGGAVVYTPLGIHNFGLLCKSYDTSGAAMNPCLNTRRQAMYNSLRDFMKKYPDTKIIQVSQNDTDRRCQCEKCLADEEYYGAPSGLIVETLNWVLEKLTKDYPDLLIVTFAYRYSIQAPENIECHPNLVIEFTPIDMCRQHAITYGECNTDDNEYPDSVYSTFMTDNQELMAEVEKWSKICDKFYMYDYGLNCRYYWTPFPDLDTLYDNYSVFNSIGAMGYINLSNPHKPSAEFGELRAYLTLKLMEEPGMTREQFDNHINEFLEGFYGDGWKIIREYYDFIHELADENGECYCGFNSPEQIFGDHAFAPYSDMLTEWFDEAEALAADDAAQLLHVRRLRVSMDYVRIGSIHYTEMNSGDEARVQAMIAEVENFYNEVFELGVEWISDAGKVPEVTDFTVNPREWGKIWPHTQIYNETWAETEAATETPAE